MIPIFEPNLTDLEKNIYFKRMMKAESRLRGDLLMSLKISLLKSLTENTVLQRQIALQRYIFL